MSQTLQRITVIGGGLAGLAAAADCISRGFEVTIVERNEHLGGKMNVLQESGFRFDMGPTIITLPEVLRGIVRRSGRRVEDEIDLVPLDPQWRCMYDDGVVVDLLANPHAMAASLEQQFPGTGVGEGYTQFIEYSRRMFRLSEKVFFYKDLGAMSDLMRSPPPRDPDLLKDVLAMRLHSTCGATVHRHISEPHVAQMCEHFLQYVGSSPFLAPSILSLIASAQVDNGCWYPMGGTRQVARTLERIVRAGAAEVITGVGVSRIRQEGGRATGVELEDGRTIDADAVISNCDVQRTMRDLLGSGRAAGEQRSVARKYSPACSGLVLYLGLDRQYDHLAHHDFLFSASSEDEFDDIYRKGIPARDPSIYLAVPSRTDPDQAPPGCEALYVLIHTPYLRDGQTWEGPGGLLEQYRPVVMNVLQTRGGMPDIEDHIVVERHLTPNHIDRMYNAEGGAIYGLASHGRLKGGFKPRNRSRVLGNLYLAGGSANPGPGVPMVLMSGVTAAAALAEDAGIAVEHSELTVSEPQPCPEPATVT
ncbi:MAG: phytoene desaturase family protein [Planctomycetota bacterium]